MDESQVLRVPNFLVWKIYTPSAVFINPSLRFSRGGVGSFASVRHSRHRPHLHLNQTQKEIEIGHGTHSMTQLKIRVSFSSCAARLM